MVKIKQLLFIFVICISLNIMSMQEVSINILSDQEFAQALQQYQLADQKQLEENRHQEIGFLETAYVNSLRETYRIEDESKKKKKWES